MKNKLKTTFRALSYRNYRLFFMGNGISLIGTWMQSIAVSWLVYRLTGSALLLGIAGFCNQIPSFFLTPFGGVIADRFSRHRIIVITQIFSMLQAFALAFLMLTNNADVLWIIILSTFLGIVNAFDMPARQSFVNEIVDNKKDLGNAIALNSSLVNSARLIGPSLGGILIATSGEAICFLINGFSYLAVIYTMLIMRLSPLPLKESKTRVLAELREGILYAYQFLPIKYILLLLSYFSLFGMQFSVLMPAFSHQVFHGGPETLGWLMTAAGGGALVGALYLASRRSVLGLGSNIAAASFGFSLCLIIFSLSSNLFFSLGLLTLAGFSMIIIMAASNTIIQTIVEENKRGRIMSLFVIAFIGMSPFGSLIAGFMGNILGVGKSMLVSGIFCLLGSLVFIINQGNFRKALRPVYEKIGIISNLTAVQETTILTTPPEKEF